MRWDAQADFPGGAEIAPGPEVADVSGGSQAELRQGNHFIHWFAVSQIEQREVLPATIVGVGEPGDVIAAAGKLAIVAAVPVDGEDFRVCQQVQRCGVDAGQVAAEKQRRAEDAPERHHQALLVGREARDAVRIRVRCGSGRSCPSAACRRPARNRRRCAPPTRGRGRTDASAAAIHPRSRPRCGPVPRAVSCAGRRRRRRSRRARGSGRFLAPQASAAARAAATSCW